MHDWMLMSVFVEWKAARVTFVLKNSNSQDVRLVAEGVVDLHVPQRTEWGPSVSVNKLIGPSDAEGGARKLEMEMQSGDVITIIARAFEIPLS